MPVLVRDMDDDAATVLMVDSNLQRENILPSERAFAFKMKLEALSHQGQRSDLTSVRVAPKLSTEIIGKAAGMSKDNVKRYIRLTNLVPDLLDLVDCKQISFNPAVELSYLSPEEQETFLQAMDEVQAAPSLSQAQRLKKLAQEGNFTMDAAREILNEVKKGDFERVTFRNEQLRRFFSAILHRAADAGHHHQTARSMAEKEIPRTRTINTIPQRALRIFWGVLLLSERAEFI